jgi:GT2 family glycosyltransferase
VISVVIPTFNRCERLARVLRALADQDVSKPFEVIVVSDGSDDGTEAMLTNCDIAVDLRWISQPNQGPAVARNRGTEMARAHLVLYLDDDVVPTTDLIRAHVDAHEHASSAAVVIGPMLDPPDHVMKPWVRWEQRMLAKQYTALSESRFEPTFRQFYTGNASIMRADVISVGGFDSRYRRAEDIELGIRLWERGTRFLFDRRARGYHYAERSFEAWRDIARVYGRFEVEFARGTNRNWQWEFLSGSYRSRHPWVRRLVGCAIRFPTLTDTIVKPSRRVIEILGRAGCAPVAQWLLSGIYAVDYWRACAESVGGAQAFRRLVEQPSSYFNGGEMLLDSAQASPRPQLLEGME